METNPTNVERVLNELLEKHLFKHYNTILKFLDNFVRDGILTSEQATEVYREFFRIRRTRLGN